ncbi:MAG: thiolase family protein [Paracoccaceae bacterium]|jgi:acetyl-CoA C-acetyltransferase|nr:thiolase family protein [Paracoccaceae bacterium]
MIGVSILAARRTAVMPKKGAFGALCIADLARDVILATLGDAGLTVGDVDELIVSNALGAGGNPARICALAAGLPLRVAGLSIDRQCLGGLDAVLLGQAMISSGQAQIVVVGGVESYSQRPLRATQFSDGRPPAPYLRPPFTPWADRDPDLHVAADLTARTAQISRSVQDAWAQSSHAKAQVRASQGWPEIVPLIGQRCDGFTRPLSPKLLARARVLSGSITVANCAIEADGAAFLVLASAARAQKHTQSGHCGPLGPMHITSGVSLGGDPSEPALAPIAAIRRALDLAVLTPKDIDLVEMMEAYAAQAIACCAPFDFEPALINVAGGALARGHPIGASGAILAVRLFHELARGYGLAAIAAAGGLGGAVIFQRP